MATGVAKAMKEKFGNQVDLKVFLVDSDEAKNYALKGSTNVYVHGEWVPLDIATSKNNMEKYLREVLD